MNHASPHRPRWLAPVVSGLAGGALTLFLEKVVPMALLSLTKLRDDVKAFVEADKAKDAKISDLEAKLADATDTAADDAVVAEIEGLLNPATPTPAPDAGTPTDGTTPVTDGTAPTA